MKYQKLQIRPLGRWKNFPTLSPVVADRKDWTRREEGGHLDLHRQNQPSYLTHNTEFPSCYKVWQAQLSSFPTKRCKPQAEQAGVCNSSCTRGPPPAQKAARDAAATVHLHIPPDPVWPGPPPQHRTTTTLESRRVIVGCFRHMHMAEGAAECQLGGGKTESWCFNIFYFRTG
jgi:hypothetical protein